MDSLVDQSNQRLYNVPAVNRQGGELWRIYRIAHM